MEQVAQLGTVPSSGGDVYGWRPTEALSAPQSGPRFELGDQLAQLTVYGWRPGEAMSTQLSGRSLEPKEQIAQRDESKTTGQGQGVRESGGQAGVKRLRKAVIPRPTTSPNRAAHQTPEVKLQLAAPEARSSA